MERAVESSLKIKINKIIVNWKVAEYDVLAHSSFLE